jgi:ATP-dependent Clp protease protease subunit
MTEFDYIPTPEEIAANVAKTLAEADAASAEARRADAEARKLDIEAQVADAALFGQRAASRMAEIALEEQERAQREYDACDFEHGKFQFLTPVTAESVNRMIDRLNLFSRTHEGEPIELLFNSPGGSVFDGMHLFDFLDELKAKGHRVTTRTQGMAASMAGILLQAGSERVMGREAWVLIHEISTIAYGKASEIEDEVELVKRLQKRVIDIFVKRSKEAHAANPDVVTEPLTVTKVRQGWKRKDWWIDSETALRMGIVDRVA